ncbi:MAG TPA: ATP-binding protein [Thermoanaerobaculia bacterium]|nr:ATP-binding protein [Thermoanaerobaculia bacterium]
MDIDSLVAVSRLTDSLSRASTLDDVYVAALDTLQSSLRVERASILLFDENDFCGFVAWRGLSDAYRAAVNGHTPWRPDTPHPEPICIADVERDASLAPYCDVFRAEGIRALGFFPLIYRDRVLGKFMTYYAAPHDFDPAEIELARTIAGQIAFGVARIRAEEALGRERERLADLIMSVPGVVWETTGTPGVDQRVTFVSPAIEDLLGYPPEAWLENPRFWDNVIVSAEPGEVQRMSLDLAASGTPAVHTFRMRTRDGRMIWTEVRVAAKNEGGKLVLRGVTLDITARKAAEARRAFLTKASGVLASSLDYETTLAQLTQLIVADLGDWCTIDIVEDDGELRRLHVEHRDPSKRAAAEQLMNRGIVTGAATRLRPVVERGDTIFVPAVANDHFSRFNVEPAARPVVEQLGLASFMVVPLSAGNRIVGALSIMSSDAARLYDDADLALALELGQRAGYAIENARLYRQAQDANRAKDEFLATLSHELRTPMTATLGWATMLRMGEIAPPEFHLAVETIERSTRAQAKLIDEILDVSRIVTGKLQLNIAPVNLQSVIEAAVDAVRPSIAAKGITLHLDFARIDGVPTGDAERLQQVIWNLLSNSVKFTPGGGSISLRVDQPQRDGVRIAVTDTGQGIPRRLLPVIFERFRQGDSSTTRTHGGLGLGLAIVKNIVELHGGNVSAASDGEGRGATFTISLPLTTASAATMIGPSLDTAPLSLSGVSVLLVEDDDDTRRMLAAALQNFGASVTAVGSAHAAIDALRRAAPNVVVSDIAMPGEDGFALMVKIRAGEIEPARNVPAVALTAYARAEDRERILASGFGFHLTKPVDPVTMVRVIREAARR